MVLLNGEPVKFINFPDGTIKVDIANPMMFGYYVVTWRYENDSEFMLIAFIKMHIDERYPEATGVLEMPFIPNARQDRVKSVNEVFTLKHFAKLINSLHFDKVRVLDPHSHVSEALFDRIEIQTADSYICETLDDITHKCHLEKVSEIVLFFPDEGAQKRYKTDTLTDYISFFGNKVREWKTGHILGLNIETHTDKTLDYLKDKTVLIIDDIISAGGTVYYSIKELEKYGVKNVYAYCSHLENTMFKEEENKLRNLLEDEGSVFKGIYTTDSIYSQKHEKVTVFEIN